jgi:hypothetical protein
MYSFACGPHGAALFDHQFATSRKQSKGASLGVEHYNNVRLNNAIGYITPNDMLAGYQHEIQAERDRKLEAARKQRKNRRQWVARRMKRITSGWPTIRESLTVSAFVGTNPTNESNSSRLAVIWKQFGS